MNKVLEFFDKLNNEEEILKKKIKVAGWKFNFDHMLLSGITPYLFEELDITEHIAREKNENRDLRVKPKVYITIHDTGDTDKKHNAKFWSDTVYKEMWVDSKEPYKASFQYVVGNDGIYHNIPDNEVRFYLEEENSGSFSKVFGPVEFKPLDKAGSYGIQELPDGILDKYEGSFENIVGLAPEAVTTVLEKLK